MTKATPFVPPASGGSYVQEKDGTLRLVEGTVEPSPEELAAREAAAREAALAGEAPAAPSRRTAPASTPVTEA